MLCAAATDLLNVVVIVHERFGRPVATLCEHGTESLQAGGFNPRTSMSECRGSQGFSGLRPEADDEVGSW